MKALIFVLSMFAGFAAQAEGLEDFIPGQVKTVAALREATSNCRSTLNRRSTSVCSAAESVKIQAILDRMEKGAMDSSIVESTFRKNKSVQFLFYKRTFSVLSESVTDLAAVAVGVKAIGCQYDSALKERALLCAVSNYSEELNDLLSKERE